MKKLCDYFLDFRHLALFVAATALAANGSALILQYGFNYQPCHLCMMQRIPYWTNIALGLIAFFTAKKSPRAAFAILILAGVSFLADMCIAGFHFGGEQKWWELPESCHGDLPQNATIQQLKEFLAHKMPVDCGRPSFVLLGLSLTGYNFLLSAFLAVFTFFHAIKGYKLVKTAPKA